MSRWTRFWLLVMERGPAWAAPWLFGLAIGRWPRKVKRHD